MSANNSWRSGFSLLKNRLGPKTHLSPASTKRPAPIERPPPTERPTPSIINPSQFEAVEPPPALYTTSLDYNPSDESSYVQGSVGRSTISKTSGALLDFSRLPKHILEDDVRMGHFSSAASERAHFSIAKHNAECGVRECEKTLQMRRIELGDAIMKLQDAERVLSELWEAALRDQHSFDLANNDAESTSSRDSN